MKINHLSASFFYFFLMSLICFALLACHPQLRPDKLTDTSVQTQTSVEWSNSENFGPNIVPKTGQTKTYMSADDGDLQAGKPWPMPRFTDHGDGTVTDRLSGLMWTQNADKANGKVDWEEAVLGAKSCTDGGYTDWRLPNRNELESLIDLGRYNPALPTGHLFIGILPSYYWTSTTPANNEDHAWIVHFYIGFVTHDDKGGSHHVWYVREWMSPKMG